MKVFLKMLSGHVLIVFLSCLMLFAAVEYQLDNYLVLCALFVVTLVLYVYNGYQATREKTAWQCYFSVAIVGVLLWAICYAVSGGSTNYKRDSGAGLWFFYELYIIPKSTLHFLHSNHDAGTLDLVGKFAFPILFSSCQFMGGCIKMHKIKAVSNSRSAP